MRARQNESSTDIVPQVAIHTKKPGSNQSSHQSVHKERRPNPEIHVIPHYSNSSINKSPATLQVHERPQQTMGAQIQVQNNIPSNEGAINSKIALHREDENEDGNIGKSIEADIMNTVGSVNAGQMDNTTRVYANHPAEADLHNSMDCDSVVRGMAEGEEISSENMYANTAESTGNIGTASDIQSDSQSNTDKFSVPVTEIETEF